MYKLFYLTFIFLPVAKGEVLANPEFIDIHITNLGNIFSIPAVGYDLFYLNLFNGFIQDKK
jgi:hypothetical protein